MITRAPRPTSNFYMLDKAISEDQRLSWAARGILIFLLGKPDHWTVSPAALTNETKGIKRSTGRDGIYAILKELQEVGYLQATSGRDAAGSFAGTDYIITETPLVVFHPHTAEPDTAEPDTAGPYPANPPQVSIELKQGLKKKQGLRGESAGAQDGFAPPAGADALQAGFEESGAGPAPVQQQQQQQEPEAKAPARPSMSTAVCIALKSIGMSSVNPGNEKLRILLDAGADIGTFVELGRKCVKDGKPFTYLLATVAGKMQDAAALAQTAMVAPQQAAGRHQSAPNKHAGAAAAISNFFGGNTGSADDGRTVDV